jgi:bacillithiol system protein YtxJ
MPLTPTAARSADDVTTLLQSVEPLLIYKHSYSCDLSAMAMSEVQAFTAAQPDVPIVLVDVIGQRSISRAIEAELGVLHESPQALLVQGGRVVWHASHRRVTQRTLAEAWGALEAV